MGIVLGRVLGTRLVKKIGKNPTKCLQRVKGEVNIIQCCYEVGSTVDPPACRSSLRQQKVQCLHN